MDEEKKKALESEGGSPPTDEVVADKKGKRKKINIVNVLIIAAFLLIFSIGLVVMFYPNISNYINEKNQSRVVSVYHENVAQLDETDYRSYLEAAYAYNAQLAERGEHVSAAFIDAAADEDKTDEYWSLLSVEGSNVMGYVMVDKINISIPIYHGSDEAVLTMGAGHLQGSSLPVGGESTHSVISAHTGLPSAKFFDGIDRLALGDTFSLRIMNEILTYEIDQILVVLPEEIDALAIETGSDYVTLLTCTPYGVNSHRLLVRGTRIETPPEVLEEQSLIASVEKTDESLGFLARAQRAIVVWLANSVEAIAQFLVNVSQWFMDIFGVEY